MLSSASFCDFIILHFDSHCLATMLNPHCPYPWSRRLWRKPQQFPIACFEANQVLSTNGRNGQHMNVSAAGKFGKTTLQKLKKRTLPSNLTRQFTSLVHISSVSYVWKAQRIISHFHLRKHLLFWITSVHIRTTSWCH